MARNTIRDELQEKQAFLLELFRNQPDIPRSEASDSYKDRFGAPLPPRLFNQMKEQVQAELSQAAAAEEVEETGAPETEVETETAAEESTAARSASETAANPGGAPKAPKAKGAKGGPRHLFIDAPKDNLEFLGRIVAQLQEAGAANVRIDHSTDRWMVLVVDGK